MSLSSGTTYTYDAEGNRVMKQGAGVTQTVFFGGRPLARLTGGQWTDLVYGPTGLLAEVPGSQSGSPVYRVSDPLGTTVGNLLADGTFVNPVDYTPFGQISSGNTTDPYLFTGKERDAESGLDNFGARYFGSNMGRFMSPDPGIPSPLHLLNPQRWNMYSYGLNNPLSYTDSTGMDAAAVNFSKEIAIVGHQGIMSVHSDGTVVYARFEPVGGSRPAGPGAVQSFTLSNKVQFDSNGQPTADSLNAVKKELATSGPEKGQDPSSIRLNYFKTTPQETANLDQWIKQQQDASNAGKAPRYNVETNNCTMFCQRGLVAAGALDQNQANHASPAPNGFYRQLLELQSRQPCFTTSASDDHGNSTGSSGCQ